MQAKEEAAEASRRADRAKAQAALPALRAALERDPRDFVANPNGKVTVTEFYDYRCPHCINIAPKVVGLIRSRPDVRFVFKEMPIFGATSEHAARAAFAAKAQGKDYVGLYEAFMGDRAAGRRRHRPDRRVQGRQHRRDERAGDAGRRHPATERHLRPAPRRSAIDGTPGFVVGDTFIRGEDFDGLIAAINKTEHKG